MCSVTIFGCKPGLLLSNKNHGQWCFNKYIPTVLLCFNLLDVFCDYCIMQHFDEGKFWHFDAFQPDRQNLTRQIVLKQYSVYRCMVKDSDHPSKYFSSNIWRVSICQIPPSPRQNFALYGIASYILGFKVTVLLEYFMC